MIESGGEGLLYRISVIKWGRNSNEKIPFCTVSVINDASKNQQWMLKWWSKTIREQDTYMVPEQYLQAYLLIKI